VLPEVGFRDKTSPPTLQGRASYGILPILQISTDISIKGEVKTQRSKVKTTTKKVKLKEKR
jgi:hypothetical protein